MKELNNNIKLGLFITLGTMLFILSLYYLGKKQNLFGNTFEIKANFSHVNGLQKGNNVRFSGIDVGTVKEITILNDTTIQVLMIIDYKVQPFIKSDAITALGNDGLMGSKLINISPGSSSSNMAKDGETLLSINELDTEDMLRHLEQTNRNIATITNSFVGIAQKIDHGEGLFGKLLNDSSMSHDLAVSLRNIRRTSDETAQLSATIGKSLSKIENDNNLIGTLLNDTLVVSDLKKTVQDLKEFSNNTAILTKEMNVILKKINSGEGAVATILTDSLANENIKQSLQNLQDGSAAFNKNMEALQHNFLFRRYFKKQEKRRNK